MSYVYGWVMEARIVTILPSIASCLGASVRTGCPNESAFVKVTSIWLQFVRLIQAVYCCCCWRSCPGRWRCRRKCCKNARSSRLCWNLTYSDRFYRIVHTACISWISILFDEVGVVVRGLHDTGWEWWRHKEGDQYRCDKQVRPVPAGERCVVREKLRWRHMQNSL